MGKKLKRRQELKAKQEVEEKTRVEGKTRRKRRQGVEDKDQEKRAQVKKMKVLDLMT
jgi:hypothetical protein